MGGLGNQMFQYAAARRVCSELKKQYDIVFDTNFLEDRTTGVVYRNFELSIFLPKSSYAIDNSANQSQGKILINDANIGHFLSSETTKNAIISDARDIYLDGYFQLYSLIEDEMKNIFCINEYSSKKTKEFFETNVTSKSLMINVRRADYVSRESAKKFHGFLDARYINAALTKFTENEIDKIFIFSDEPDWCKTHLNLQKSFIVNHEYAGDKFQDYFSMMSKFNNLVIPNSTFAWWAAWVSQRRGYAKKIVAPGKSLWFVNNQEKASLIVPNDWIQIESSDIKEN